MSCQSNLRFWCAPEVAGLPGLTLQELATQLDPLMPGNGKIAQVVAAESSALFTTTAQIPNDDTIPQQTEGAEFLTVTITPGSASSILQVEASCFFTLAVATAGIAALFRDATANAIAALVISITNGNNANGIYIRARVAASITSATTFKWRIGNTDGSTSLQVNGVGGGRLMGGVAAANLTVTEILP